MIRMEQPSFCFNFCDVGEPHYKMWRTIVGPEGMTVNQLTAENRANMLALQSQGSPLLNIILNAHGYAGGLRIAGLRHSAMEKNDLGPFGVFKKLNIGTIWIVSCDIADSDTGKNFCHTLAVLAGTLGDRIGSLPDSNELTRSAVIFCLSLEYR